MYILTVRAFADFDIPYEVYVGALKDKVRADCLKEKLNEWVNNQPNVNQDIRLSKILEDESLKYEFCDIFRFALVTAIPQEYIDIFVNICLKAIEDNYVYLNKNIFDVEEIKVFSNSGVE